MGFTKKQPELEEAPGAPEWMLTFSDCMTLLLTFFVLLISFSAPGSSDIKGLSDAVANILPGFDWANKMYRDSMSRNFQFYPAEGVEAGSEKPTPEKGTKGSLKETPVPPDFDRAKVFLIPSGNIFCGKGSVISPGGRDIMATMASFLGKVPNRVVICEHGPKENNNSKEMGLERAWAVMEYLTTKHNLNKKRLAISSSPVSITAEESFESSEPNQPTMETERILEIVVLDRSSYN
jgi:chemotaxis protein MotB